MQTHSPPNEILIRFRDPTSPGETVGLQGAHVKRCHWTYTDEGVFVAAAEGPPQSIAVADQEGFPLEDILGEALTSALLDRDAKGDALAAMTGERDAAVTAAAAAQAAKAAAEATIATLQQQLADAQAALAEAADASGAALSAEVAEMGT